MELSVIFKLLIPVALIGVGIWLKKSENIEQNKMRKLWWLFITIGTFLFIFRIIKYV
jgi:hypothetical protein